MSIRRKDVVATALTTLVVLVFISTQEGWNVPLVGASHRWAAGTILLLGIGTCGLGSPGKDAVTKLLAVLGVGALVLAVIALITASLTPLSLLVVDILLLWAISTFRHFGHISKRPIAV